MAVGPVRRDGETAAFFDAAARGALLIRRCAGCATAAEPQAVTCPACGSAELRPEEASGGATLISWTVSHPRPTGDGSSPPAILAIGQLDEGPWWWAKLVGADPDNMRAGQRLEIGFERSGEHEAVPVFRLAEVPAPGDLRPLT